MSTEQGATESQPNCLTLLRKTSIEWGMIPRIVVFASSDMWSGFMGKTLGDPLESLKTYSSNLASNVGGSRSEVWEGGVFFCWTLLIFRKNKKCERKRVLSSVENQGVSTFVAQNLQQRSLRKKEKCLVRVPNSLLSGN